MTGQIIGFDSVWHRAGKELADKIQLACSVRERIRIIEATLLARWEQRHCDDRLIDAVVKTIIARKETSFKLVKYENNEAVFENPQHDFPRRIIYRLEKDGSLAAAIEGMSTGKLKKIDLPMKRAKGAYYRHWLDSDVDAPYL